MPASVWRGGGVVEATEGDSDDGFAGEEAVGLAPATLATFQYSIDMPLNVYRYNCNR